MKRNLLLTPGPTQIPDDICQALGRPIIHHRTPQFQQYLKECTEGLKYVFQTKHDVYFMVASGTGALEAAVVNVVSPGDHVITVEGGKFGERWTEIAKAYGIVPHPIAVEWGKAVTPAQIEEALKQHPEAKAVFTTLCETSTGVTTDIKAIAGVVKKTGALLVVDAVSGLGVTDLQMDNWGVDLAVSASHKGFMLPPGLAFIAVNDKAYARIEASKSPRYYFDLRKYKKAAKDTDTPFTSAIGIIVALTESLKKIRTEGLENGFARFERLAKATRAAVKGLGLQLLADDSCISNVLTAVYCPEGVEGGKLVKTMRDAHGISIAGGQGYLKGKIFRIAHMGCVSEEDLKICIATLEQVLGEMGYKFEKGAGLAALQTVVNQ